MLQAFPAWIVVAAMALVVLMLLVFLASLYHKAAPDEALVVYGFRGPRIVVGGGTVIYPLVENYRRLSLELMSFEVAPKQDLHALEGAMVAVEAMAWVKVKSNLNSIYAAAEWFLSKTLEQREELIGQMMESHLRTVVAHLSVEQIVKEPETLAHRIAESCAADIEKMGLEIVSFRIKQVREQQVRH
jgi:flotillin